MLQLRCFGGLTLLSGDAPVSGVASRRRSLALLAIAASQREAGIEDELTFALLWPDFDAPRARNNLKQAVFALRQSMGPNIFVRNGSTLRIDPALVDADVWDFERAVTAGAAADVVAIYSGPFLNGFHIPGLIEFDRWVEKERTRLGYLYVDALRVLAQGAEIDGNYAQAVAWWRKLAIHDPLSETYAHNLIRALAESGDVPGALQYARIHEKLLREELDVSPGPAFQQLLREVRIPDSKSAGGLRVTTPSAPMPAIPARSGARSRQVATPRGAPVVTAQQPQLPRSSIADVAVPVSSAVRVATPAVTVDVASAVVPSIGSGIAVFDDRGTTISTLPVAPQADLYFDPLETAEQLISAGLGPEATSPNLEIDPLQTAERVVLEQIGVASTPRLRRTKRRGFAKSLLRTATAASAILLAAAVGARSGLFGTTNGSIPDRASVVVLPFADPGADSGSLGSTVTELLATSLDGSLGLRAVPADGGSSLADTLRRKSMIASRAAARRFVDRIGASLYITGEIFRSGDRLRITAELRDASSDEPHERAVSEGSRTELFAIVDRIATQILASRVDGRREVTRLASTITSLPAAKAYFAAEEALRSGRFRAAIDSYTEATEVDSSFALAYYGLSAAADALGDNALAEQAANDALRHSARLPARQRRLLGAYVARQRGEIGNAERLYSRLVADYPADDEAWLGLAETLFHLNPLRGRPASEAASAFERVVLLDHRNTSAHLHLARIAAVNGDAVRAAEMVLHARTVSPEDQVRRFALHVLALGTSGVDAGRNERGARGRELNPDPIALLTRPRADEWRRFASRLALSDASPDERAFGLRLGSLVEAGEGRIARALTLLDSCATTNRSLGIEALSWLASLPFIPMDAAQISRVRDEVVAWSPDPHAGIALVDSMAHVNAHPQLRLYRYGLLSVRLGELAVAERVASQLEDMARAVNGGGTAEALAISLRARVAAGRGKTQEAMSLLKEAADARVATASTLEVYDRLLYAQLLEQAGRLNEALAYYRQIGPRSPFELPLVWQAELGMARVYSAWGDRPEAIRHFRNVATLLKNADAVLSSWREAANEQVASIDR